MEEKAASAPMLRIPAMLMPSYNGVMATEDGKQAPKRVRVLCGVCEKLRYYSIHRGVTRIGGVIACEACRHFYQKFKRQPCILTCLEGGSCLVLNDNSRNRCRACWIGHILSRCPVPPELYQNFISHLPKEIQEKMPPESQVAELIPENRKGSLGLEVSRNGAWEDVTVAAQPTTEDSGIEPYESLENNYDGDSSMEASLGHNPGGVDNFSLRNFIMIDEGLDSEDEEPSGTLGLGSESTECAADPATERWESQKRRRRSSSDIDCVTPGNLLETMLRSPSPRKTVDEDDSLAVFCLFMSSQLKTIDDPVILQDVKFKIQCTIHEGIKESYNKSMNETNRQYSKSVRESEMYYSDCTKERDRYYSKTLKEINRYCSKSVKEADRDRCNGASVSPTPSTSRSSEFLATLTPPDFRAPSTPPNITSTPKRTTYCQLKMERK